jgi:hypothetical protein
MTDILEAVRSGRFYASSGLELAAHEADRSAIRLELADATAVFEAVGSGGDVLDRAEGTVARFALPRGLGGYVRVRATAADGRQLWTQPMRL